MKKLLTLTMMLFAFASISKAQTCATPTLKSVTATSATSCIIAVNVPSGTATCGAIYVQPTGTTGYISYNTSPCANPTNPAFVMHYNVNDPSKSYMDASINSSYVAGGTTYQLKNGDNFYFTGYCTDCSETTASPVYQLKFGSGGNGNGNSHGNGHH
jgi:hypothetical protein